MLMRYISPQFESCLETKANLYAGTGIGVGVGIGVDVGTRVGVGLGPGVGVAVGCGVMVGVGEGPGVGVGSSVGLWLGVALIFVGKGVGGCQSSDLRPSRTVQGCTTIFDIPGTPIILPRTIMI